MACIILSLFTIYTLQTFMFAGLSVSYAALNMKNTIFHIATCVLVVLVYLLIMGDRKSVV